MLFLYSSLNRLKITQNKIDAQLAELTNITSEENKNAIRLPFHRVKFPDVSVNVNIQMDDICLRDTAKSLYLT